VLDGISEKSGGNQKKAEKSTFFDRKLAVRNSNWENDFF
jgi:hypothetical protein